jgi:hypothetical protein
MVVLFNCFIVCVGNNRVNLYSNAALINAVNMRKLT